MVTVVVVAMVGDVSSRDSFGAAHRVYALLRCSERPLTITRLLESATLA
jgi:hypothetical protein